MAEIASARRQQGAVRSHLTRIEREIAKMKGKETPGPSDKWKIERLLEHVKDDDKEFEECHLEVLSYVSEEDQNTIDAEEKVYDAHSSRVLEK